MESKEQKRSKFALEQLSTIKAINEDLANFIVGTPTMILQNGFGQTMAFLKSKSKKKNGQDDLQEKHNFVFYTIMKWSKKENSSIKADPKGFFDSISDLDQMKYLILQEEALKLLQWLKRYARAFQEEKKEHQGDK